MYNQETKLYRIDAESGEDLTTDQIKAAIDWHKTNIVKTMKKLEKYAQGYNQTIKDEESAEKEAKNIPNNVKSYGYGKTISEGYTNYLISNPADYTATDTEYLSDIKMIQAINDDRTESKIIVDNLVNYGIAGKAFYYSGTAKDLYISYVSVDPQEFVAIYDYSVKPRLLAVARYYSKTTTTQKAVVEDKIIELYTESNVYVYNYGSADMGEGKVHGFKQVPFVVYGGGKFSGMIYSVIDQIDAHDSIQNMNLNELSRFEMSLLVIAGYMVDPEELQKGKSLGTIQLKSTGGTNDAIKFLTKDVNATFNIDSRDNSKKEIFDLSGIIDYSDPSFSAESGIALRLKMLGMDNKAKSIEDRFIVGEQKSIDIITAGLDKAWISREQYIRSNPDRMVSVNMVENVPTDILNKITIATAAKAFGIPMSRLLQILPVEVTGENIDELLAEIEEEQANQQEQDFIELQDQDELQE